MGRFCVLAALLSLLTGCSVFTIAKPLPWQTSVVIDSSFDTDHSEAIVRGVYEWNDRAPKMHMTPVLASRADVVLQTVQRSREDVIYIVNDNGDLEACQDPPEDSNTLIAFTRTLGERAQIICMLAFSPLQRYSQARWQTITMHEIGHAFGLQHVLEDRRAVMRPMVPQQSPHLACEDVAQFCGLWNCRFTCDWSPE